MKLQFSFENVWICHTRTNILIVVDAAFESSAGLEEFKFYGLFMHL